MTVSTRGENAANIERLRANVAMQNRLGIDSRVISSAEWQELEPFAYTRDVDYVAYEPESGYVDSIQATTSMIEAARRAGATIREGVEATAISTSGGRVTGISASDGTHPADMVVCAAGPWSTALMAPAGIELPVSTIRVQFILACGR